MTIGEFSARCGLSAKVLRTYADLGVLVPTVIDPASGYRYYEASQLPHADIVALLRQAGVPVADIGRFLAAPTAEALDGWEWSLTAEIHSRQEALAGVRSRLGICSNQTRGVAMIEVRPAADRAEMVKIFNLASGQIAEPIDVSDSHRFRDLDERFPADQQLMVVAIADGRPVGGAFAFRTSDDRATLRLVGAWWTTFAIKVLDADWSRPSRPGPAGWASRASRWALTTQSGSGSTLHRQPLVPMGV